MRPAISTTGVIPVLETPFEHDGRIDRTSFQRIVEYAAAAGADAVMYPGYASEMLKLSDAERRTLIADLLANSDTTSVIVSIPDHGTRNAMAWAAMAAQGGASAINILPPYLLRPEKAQILDHIEAIAGEVFPLPLVLQFAPNQTGTELTATDMAALATRHSNLSAVKVEATPPGPVIAELTALAPRIATLVGYAGLYLPEALKAGAVGVQPGTSFLELYAALWRLHSGGDTVEFHDLHRRMQPYLASWMRHVELIVAVEKLISRRRGLVTSDLCRAPTFTVTAALVREVDQFLAEFRDYLPRLGIPKMTGAS